MAESSKTVSYAAVNTSLKEVVASINRELERLAAAGIRVAPEHVRSSLTMNDHGPHYLGSFSYLAPSEVPA